LSTVDKYSVVLCLLALLLCFVYHAPVSRFSLGSESRALSNSSPLISCGSFVSNSFTNCRQFYAKNYRKRERAANTLDKFGITYEEVKAVAARNVQHKLGVGSDGFSSTKDALPFSEDTKLTLNKTCEIADHMKSPTVRSEHVLLVLMGYNNGNKIESVPVIGVLKDMPTLRRANIAFSDDLVNDKVVIGGQSGSTNTLSDFGVT
jgi:hypothetical protein